MPISVEEFAEELFQDVLSEGDAAGEFMETVFFERCCSFLTEAGELDTADRVFYSGPPKSGIRVDGYGGDPIDASGCLSLIITDFQHGSELGRLTQTEMNQMFSRLEKFLVKSLESSWRNSLEESDPAFGLADTIAMRWKDTARVRMFLVSNRQLSDRVDGREAGDLDGKPVTYSVWDVSRLHRFATAGQGREDIEIDFEADFGGALPLLPAHLSTDDYESYLAVVPGEMLGSIYDRWGARLLEQNVRVFLQARGNVNKGIRETLEHDPSMFFAYNNGVTATAEHIETKETKGQMELTKVRNLQIVNGGQTTASIHLAQRNKSDLSKVFVQMKLSIVEPARSEQVVPKISEYANSQNRVNAADFFANHPYHVRMEEFSRRMYAPSPDGTFRETKWFYERARGQYNDARSLMSPAQRKKFDLECPRSQLFTKTDLAKYLNVWERLPDKVSLGAQKNFGLFAQEIGKVWNKNSDSFNEEYYKDIVAKAIVFKRTEKIVSSQDWYEGGYRANIVAYAIAKMAHDVREKKRVVDFHSIWSNQSIPPEMEHALTIVSKAAQDILVNPPSGIRNVTEWAKKSACWDRLKTKGVRWPVRFIDSLVSESAARARRKQGIKDQKQLNGIEAQTVVVKAGGQFWKKVGDWGRSHKQLSEKDAGVLSVASHVPNKIPSEKQCLLLMEIYTRLKSEGLNMELPS